MNAFLWISSSATMAALLLLLAARALRELLGVKLPLPAPEPEPIGTPSRLSPAAWPWPVLFAVSLAILWLGALASHIGATHSASGFFAHYWERFTQVGDSPHYLYIAENGYARSGEQVNKIVFYPLYPLLMGLLGRLLGGRTALAGLVVSQVCYGFSTVVLAKLAKKECAHPGAAVVCYWLYPFMFFSQGVFTEGLFLLLTLSGLYLTGQRRWLAAGCVGFLAALTRIQGVLLLLPGVYCAWRAIREETAEKRWRWPYLALAGPVLGFGVYLAINQIICGDPFAFNAFQSAPPWYQSIQWLGDTIVQQRHMALDYPGLAKWIYGPQLALYYLGAALLFLGFYRRLDTPWLLYGTAYLGMCYTAGWLISGGRYMLGCLPLYLCVGRIKTPILRYGLLAAEAVWLWYMSVWFMQGQAIM